MMVTGIMVRDRVCGIDGVPVQVTSITLSSNDLMKIHLEGNTSSMHATVLLQTVCNTIVHGHRDFSNNITDLLIWGGILMRD